MRLNFRNEITNDTLVINLMKASVMQSRVYRFDSLGVCGASRRIEELEMQPNPFESNRTCGKATKNSGTTTSGQRATERFSGRLKVVITNSDNSIVVSLELFLSRTQ